MIDPKRIDPTVRKLVRDQSDSLVAGLEINRRSWWVHWSQIAEMLFPRRYKWFVTPNQFNRGSNANQAIIDSTGVIAARTCAAGMMGGLTDPNRPWFRLGLHGMDDDTFGPVKLWLAECERRMFRVFDESNFYQSIAQLYVDLTAFTTGVMCIFEDSEEVIRCYNPCQGEYFLGVGPTNSVDIYAREFPLTVDAAVRQFGIENVSESTAQAYRSGGAQRTNEIIIRHVIEPNTRMWDAGVKELPYVVPPSFKYREIYWERSGGGDALLSLAGYREKPFMAGRWSLTSNDAYGTAGPGMDALGDLRQLQIEQRRKAEAIDKLVRPPMVASVSMKNEPSSVLPGAVNYVADLQGAGFKPAYQVDPRIQELSADIAEVQNRIKTIFFNDLFMMISSLQTVRTATEIDARREEKLIQLGPVIERFLNEVLDPIIDRVFAIMSRRGLFPPPPPEIAGAEIDVQYISMLAEASTATATGAIERLLALAGNLVGVDPSIMDNIDLDEAVDDYANLIKVNPKLIREKDAVAAIRKQRADQQAATAAAQATAGLAQVGKTLSETDTGGGTNALQALQAANS